MNDVRPLVGLVPHAVLVGLFFVLSAFGEPARALLRLETSLVSLEAEPWRLLTGHLVHLSIRHAALNAATSMLFALALPPLRRPRVLLMLGLGAVIGVDAGLLLFHQDRAWYVGFSGVVYGLLAGACLLELKTRPRLYGLVLAGLLVKLVKDEVFGSSASTEAFVGGTVLARAHVYGVLGGSGAAGLIGLSSWPKGQVKTS